MRWFFVPLLAVVFLSGCADAVRALRSDDPEFKKPQFNNRMRPSESTDLFGV